MRKASTLAIGCLVAVFMTYAIAAPVYTWIDQDGVTHYSETPPENHAVDSEMIELEPAPAAGPAPDDDYFSVIRQAERMEKSRLENEKVRTERLQAEAAVRRAAAAEQARPTRYDDETKRYLLSGLSRLWIPARLPPGIQTRLLARPPARLSRRSSIRLSTGTPGTLAGIRLRHISRSPDLPRPLDRVPPGNPFQSRGLSVADDSRHVEHSREGTPWAAKCNPEMQQHGSHVHRTRLTGCWP